MKAMFCYSIIRCIVILCTCVLYMINVKKNFNSLKVFNGDTAVKTANINVKNLTV